METLTPVRAAPRRAAPSLHEAPRDRLGAWSLYFALKLALYFRGHIPLDIPLNLLFFAALLASAEPGMPSPIKAARRVTAWLLAAALLWHDSWLPAPEFVLRFLRTGGLPSAAYLASFVAPLLVARETLGLAAGAAALLWARARVHLTWPIAAGFFFAGVHQSYHPAAPGLDGRLARFYESQARERVTFAAGPGAPDLLLVQVCSLSQDDLAAAGLAGDPFWSGFDVLFTNFNTVTAHSGPAALRLLRAGCGQAPHRALYEPAPAGCLLLDALRAAGYRGYAVFDHDGSYQGFAETVRRHARVDEPLPLTGLAADRVAFDGGPMYDDAAVLGRWLDRRQADGGGPALLYANLVTLHTGAHKVGAADWWRTSRRARYREAFADLARGLDSLERRVRASGRPTVLAFVPEHGAALRGSSLQVDDLREMPLPYITIAPAGLKLLNFPGPKRAPLSIDRPVSYQALAAELSEILRSRAPAESPPGTPFVAENEHGVVLESGGRYFLKARQGSWTPLPPDALAGRRLP